MEFKKLRLNISTRIFLSFFVLITAFAINALITYFIIEKNIVISNKIFLNSNPSLQNLERFKLLVNESKMFSTSWVFLPAKSEDKNELINVFEIKYPEQRKILLNLATQWQPPQTDSLKSILLDFEKLLSIDKKIIDNLKTFEDYEDPIKKMESELIIEDEVLPRTQRLLNSINLLIEDKKNEINIDENSLVEAISGLRVLVIVLALILIIMALVFSYFNSRYISKPIIKIKTTGKTKPVIKIETSYIPISNFSTILLVSAFDINSAYPPGFFIR